MLAHTAIHIFNRALQNQGIDIFVRKAEEKDYSGKAWIQPKIPIDALFEAEKVVNQIIAQNLPVTAVEYPNLQEAIKAEPKLRYNYQRIDENERIRVVKIGDFDVAACVREHVKSTAELVAFSLSGINYRGDETEVNYLVGKEAIDFANSMKNVTLLIKREFNFNNPFADVKNAIEELRNSKKTLASLIKTYLKEKKYLSVPQEIELDKEIRDAVIDATGKEGLAILISGNNIFAFSPSNMLESLSKHLNESNLIKGIAKENIISGKILDINQVSLLIQDFLSKS